MSIPAADTALEVRKPTEQAHILLGTYGLGARDEARPAMSLLTTILGGGMSSRLFQSIREEHALAYSTYAFEFPYSDTGIFGMYAGCASDKVEQVKALMLAQWEALAQGQLDEAELARACGQMEGAIALGLEDNSSRMTRLGRSEMIQGRITPISSTLKQLEAVTVADIANLAQELLLRSRAQAVVLPE